MDGRNSITIKRPHTTRFSVGSESRRNCPLVRVPGDVEFDCGPQVYEASRARKTHKVSLGLYDVTFSHCLRFVRVAADQSLKKRFMSLDSMIEI